VRLVVGGEGRHESGRGNDVRRSGILRQGQQGRRHLVGNFVQSLPPLVDDAGSYGSDE